MTSEQFYSPAPVLKPGIHWPSAIQFGLSLAAAFLSLSSAVGLAGVGFAQLINPANAAQRDLTIFTAAASALLTGILLVPSAWFSLLRLIGGKATGPAWLVGLSSRPLPVGIALVLALLVFLAGNFVANIPQAAWLLLPPLHLLAVGLPVYIFSTLGRWQLSAGSQQRSWGIFAAGLVLGPAIILVLEILAGAAIVLFGILYVSLRPDLQGQMALLGEQINAAGNSPDAILKLLEPYLFNPLVLLTTFAFLSGVVPLIEEALKPIGVWLVAGSHLTAAQGFAAGLISGSGYALFENLALSNTGSDWTATLVGRVGTGLLHITTAGLTGWALATAINQRRYLRFGAVYLLAVLIHGLWNALAVVSAASGLDLTGAGSLGVQYAELARLSKWATVGLGGLVIVIFLVLLAFNRSMRRQTRSQVV